MSASADWRSAVSSSVRTPISSAASASAPRSAPPPPRSAGAHAAAAAPRAAGRPSSAQQTSSCRDATPVPRRNATPAPRRICRPRALRKQRATRSATPARNQIRHTRAQPDPSYPRTTRSVIPAPRRGYLAEHSTQAPSVSYLRPPGSAGGKQARAPRRRSEIPAASAGMTEEVRGYDERGCVGMTEGVRGCGALFGAGVGGR